MDAEKLLNDILDDAVSSEQLRELAQAIEQDAGAVIQALNERADAADDAEAEEEEDEE